MSLAEQKRVLRAAMQAAREGMVLDRRAAAERVRDRFLERFADRLAAEPRPAVSAYWPVGAELDVRPLLVALDRLGCVCALPAVVARGQPLAFRRWAPGDRLIAAGFGLSEPVRDAEAVRPAIVIAPLLAVDREGRRLGYGGGFYDRTIRALRAERPTLVVGVGYDLQVRDGVPAGPEDEAIDWIVTEKRAVRCGEAQ